MYCNNRKSYLTGKKGHASSKYTDMTEFVSLQDDKKTLMQKFCTLEAEN